jgi:hypothetical protein
MAVRATPPARRRPTRRPHLAGQTRRRARPHRPATRRRLRLTATGYAADVVYSPELLDLLQAIDPAPWTGQAFRHMFGDHPPDAENTRGARWNPPGIAAIYTSLTRGGALAEAEHQIAIQPIRPRARRTVYTLEITLASVLDLTDPALLQNLGVGPAELAADDMIACRQLGGAAQRGQAFAAIIAEV